MSESGCASVNDGLVGRLVVNDPESSIYARTRSGLGNSPRWLGGMTRTYHPTYHPISRGTCILSARKQAMGHQAVGARCKTTKEGILFC